MIIDKEIVEINLSLINLKIKRLSYTDFISVACFLKSLSVLDIYDILINENYKKCHLIDMSKEWLIRSIQIQFKYLGNILSYFLARFIVSKGGDNLFFLKLSQEGVLIYLDNLLSQKYNDYFKDNDNNINKILYNNLKSQGVFDILLIKGGINTKKLSHIEYLKYSNSKSLRMIQVLSGLSLENDNENQDNNYDFNCEKYIEGLLSIIKGYFNKEIKDNKIIIDYANMFSDDIEQKIKYKIGKNNWGESLHSKEYIFCKYSK